MKQKGVKKSFSAEDFVFSIGTVKDLEELRLVQSEHFSEMPRAPKFFSPPGGKPMHSHPLVEPEHLRDKSGFGMPLPNMRFAANDGRRFFIVAREKIGGKAIGFALVSLRKDVVFINSVAVLQAYSGSVGKILLRKAEEYGAKALEQKGVRASNFALNAAYHYLRNKLGRNNFVHLESDAGRAPHDIRVRWLRMQGYSPKRFGSNTLVKQHKGK